jgi:hypothetical protein
MENEINFLSFPRVNESMAIFGAGYGWEALARCPWLHACALHYWGDIDTHGFGILSQLRTHFDHAESFLMDRATLNMHREFWGIEDSPLRVDLLRLTKEEQALYSSLQHDSIREGLRLEQGTHSLRLGERASSGAHPEDCWLARISWGLRLLDEGIWRESRHRQSSRTADRTGSASFGRRFTSAHHRGTSNCCGHGFQILRRSTNSEAWLSLRSKFHLIDRELRPNSAWLNR